MVMMMNHEGIYGLLRSEGNLLMGMVVNAMTATGAMLGRGYHVYYIDEILMMVKDDVEMGKPE